MNLIKTTFYSFLSLFTFCSLFAQPVTWDASTSYSTGALVIVDGSTYIATTNVDAGNTPPDTRYWKSLEETAASLTMTTAALEALPTTEVAVLLATLPGAAPDANSSSGAASSFSSADILIENTVTGERAVWDIYGAYQQFMTEDVLLSGGATINTYSTTTKVVGSGDFDLDGKIDIITQDTTTGLKQISFMNGNIIDSTIDLTTTATSINVVGVADFNSDGKLDLVTENTGTGEKRISFITGTGKSLSITSSSLIETNSGFRIVGAADFDSDGKPDLLAEQVTTSSDPSAVVSRVIWIMNGATKSSTVSFLNFAQEWSMKGTGDYDKDGKVDILVEQTTGRKGIWYMDGTSIREGFVFSTLLPEWTTCCSGDLNADGSNDCVFQNTKTGKAIVLNLGNQDGTLNSFGKKYAYLNVNRSIIPAGNSDATVAWKMRGFIDYNGDGSTDILADNMTTGERAVWTVNSSSVLTSTIFTTVGTDWRIVATGAFGGDSTTDIVVENTSTGEKKIWIMVYSGGSFSISSEESFATDANYRIVGSGDFNGDSNQDLVVEQLSTSSVATTAVSRTIWYMNGTSKSSEELIINFAQEWRIRGAKDFDANGTPDLIIQQDGSGRRGVWYMTGSKLTEGFIFTTVPPEWSLSLQ